MEDKYKSLLLIFSASIFTSLGQIFWKMGINKLNLSLIYLNYFLMIGFFLYGLSAIITLLAFKYGELSMLYPLLAISYVWVSFLSPLFFISDFMNPLKWFGVCIIILGVSLIGWSGKKK